MKKQKLKEKGFADTVGFSFKRMLDCGILSQEEFETVQAIQMKGKREEIKKLFRDNGLEDKFKFTYCKSDDRYKLRIPTALRSKYDLRRNTNRKVRKRSLTQSTVIIIICP